jgi:signal peptidase I
VIAVALAGTLAVVVAGWIRRALLVVTVRGASMRPTYADGERVLVRRTTRRVRPGQVVVFGDTPPGRSLLIKRIAAVPGDAVPIEFTTAVSGGHVPPGRFLVLGDNPPASVDSREFGYLERRRLVGRVVRRLPQDPAEQRHS